MICYIPSALIILTAITNLFLKAKAPKLKSLWICSFPAAAIYSAEWWQIAILVENPISFAGDSNAPDVNRLFWVPIWIYWLPRQWYFGIQGTPKPVNWENDAALTFPLSLRLGKLTKFGRRAVNVFVEPEYTAIHDDNIPVPEWSVRLGINFHFPEGF